MYPSNRPGGGRSTIWLDDDPYGAPAPLPPSWEEDRPPYRSEPAWSYLVNHRNAGPIAGVVVLFVGLVVGAALLLTGGGSDTDAVGSSDDQGAALQPLADIAGTANGVEVDPAASVGGTLQAGSPADVVSQSADPNGGAAPIVPLASIPGSPSSTRAPTTTATTAAPVTTVIATVTTTVTAAPTSPTTAAPTTAAPTTAAPTTVSAPTQPTPAPNPPGNDASVQREVLDLTNAERTKAGCPSLTLNSALNVAADGHSEDMAANDYFSHQDLNGNGPGVRVAAAGYGGRGWAENIAAGYSNATAVVNGWMNSDGHRRNILDCDFVHLGVGYATAQNGSGGFSPIYWTQVFGGG